MDGESAAPILPAEFHGSFFQQSPDAMFVADPQGRLIAVNSRSCDVLGFSAAEMLGRPYLDFVNPADLRENPPRLSELHAGMRVVTERRLRHKDGRLIPVELGLRMLPDGHLLGVGRDVSERRRVEEETTTNHLQILSILEANADPVYVADPVTYEVLYVNRALVEAFGAPDQRKCYEYLQHRAAPCPFCTNDKIFGENFGRTFVWELQNEATGRWYRCLDRAITWPDGRVVRYEMTTDLTERKRAEEALRESEERYRTLVEQASDGVVVTDADGRCLSVNQAFADMLGYPVQALSQFCFRDLVAEAPRPKAEDASAGTDPLRERSIVRKDGSIVTVEASVRTLADGRRLAIVRDVTGRELAERALGDEALPYGAVATGSDFRVQRVNSIFSTLLGYAPEELVGRSVAELTHPDDLDSSQELLARLKRREIEQFVIEKRYLTRSGGAVHAVTFVRGFYAAGGALVGTTAAVVDVSERARAESALRESEGRYRMLFEGASDAIFLVEGGRFADCNARTLQVFGCARDEILGHHPGDFSPPEQRDGSASAHRAEVWMSAALAGAPQSFEWLHCRKDGTPFDAEVSLVRVEWQGRVYLQAIVRDVTERRRAEEARLELERRLLHAQKLESLGVLAGGIAHDFNNLLMAILGNLELGLRDLSPGSPVRSRLDAAGQAARRAADLTRQMLAYSGRGKFLVGRVDLNELVQENVHLLRTSVPRTVTLNLHLDRVLPAVEADAGQVQQVIMNLITNAAEAIGNEPGVVTLATGVRDCDDSYLRRSCLDEEAPAGRYAYVEVTDSGCGMDEETQKRMFDPFFTTKFTGRGLGLPAVFGIVRGHGGAILLDSATGKGTTIRVLFPAAENSPPPAVPVKDAPAGVAGVARSTKRGTILIVDDEEMVRQPTAAMVESLGFAVLTAVDGEEAVEVVRRHGARIRAIILDLTMPKLDGAGALDRILRIQPDAKVILSSGYDEGEATGRVAKELLAGFIRKPYRLEQLQGTLERVLGTSL
jgi:PAS domain S-box-containing protein